jgi:murein L,D-transpeptidase YcbB/YkuD
LRCGIKLRGVENRATLRLAIASVCWLAALNAAYGQRLASGTASAELSTRIRAIAVAGRLSGMRWPDFSTYRVEVLQLYEGSGFAPLWLDGAAPTRQALTLIQAFEQSETKGLNPEDYDCGHWEARLRGLHSAPSVGAMARFDVALMVSAMRYVSDLHSGRIKPVGLNFEIDGQSQRYDLVRFLSQKLIHAVDVRAALAGIEPQYEGYRRTELALDRYLALARRGDGPRVPGVKKTVSPGEKYGGTAQLAQRLELLGDMPASALAEPMPDQYAGALVAAVERFQARHGLTVDGKLGQQTIRALNVPLATRVRQLADALERWRWLPESFPNPPIVVNIPEFELRAIGPSQRVVLAMKVVVGKAMRTQTPVFAAKMRYVVFRPYWNVPRSILRKEIIPDIVRNRSYLASHGFEVTDRTGRVVTSGPISDAVLSSLRSGEFEVRQKPGAKSSLGLVKFLFPNEHDVYLHDTPATQLFARSRRDFSHGCIRVQKPAELAAWLLRSQKTEQGKPWTLETVRVAMESGPDNQRVTLAVPVPVLILYDTAVVEEDGSVHFFEDIYGYDHVLEAKLAQGRPYPRIPAFR